MSVEDFWWDAHNELNKMEDQDHHKYKDTRDKWTYALNKIKKINQ